MSWAIVSYRCMNEQDEPTCEILDKLCKACKRKKCKKFNHPMDQCEKIDKTCRQCEHMKRERP